MEPKAISIFSGVGGLDYGFEAAGFRTCATLDFDPVACATMRLNRAWPVLEGPISEFSGTDILEAAKLVPGEADVLIGGPPCQPFSKSGYWASGDARRLSDPRADTLTHYLRVLEETLPKSFLLENVPGLVYRGKAEGIAAIQSGIRDINSRTGSQYSFEYKVLDASDFGVPQMRERVFIVGARDGTKFSFPEPTHGDLSPDQTPQRTCWDAFADLAPPSDRTDLTLKGKWADLLPTIPEGHNYLWHTERGGGEAIFGWRRRYWNFLLKLSKNRPAWTIQAQPGPATGPFHWDNRKLSAAELCRLQTFPDGLKFNCKHSDIQRLVGNAVPSALAEILAREIAWQLLGASPQTGLATLVPTRQNQAPSPEVVAPVPTKFLHLVGSDSDHPGTGQGRSAMGRDSKAA